MNNVAADEIPFDRNIFFSEFTVITFTIVITVSGDFFLILDDDLRVKVASHYIQL